VWVKNWLRASSTAWELETPAYNVYFSEKGLAPAGIPADRVAPSSAEFEIRGAADGAR
jgi:hypothetical protein